MPPYDATVTRRLREAGVVVLGKTNMDEFAMGSSTEHSAYGPTHNPWDLTRIPGGSGGGSAAAVASFEAPIAIGTDTGGSIRQPAAVTGTVGVKPTYGGVSRYGLVALASSLDQAGPCARTVLDAALLHAAVAGHDPLDSTSIDAPVPDVVVAAARRRRHRHARRRGQAVQRRGLPAGCRAAVPRGGVAARGARAPVVEVDCPHFDYALPAYYLILPSECSRNLARFDAMRYGLRVGDDGTRSAEEVMALTRDAGFGAEAKRRIIIGTYALSSGYYDAYYGQAQKVRTLIARDFEAAFAQVDVLVSPTTPTTAFPLGERVDDPMAMYLADLCTIPSNLAGNASMSSRAGLARRRAAGRPADHGPGAWPTTGSTGSAAARRGGPRRPLGAPADRRGTGALADEARYEECQGPCCRRHRCFAGRIRDPAHPRRRAPRTTGSSCLTRHSTSPSSSPDCSSSSAASRERRARRSRETIARCASTIPGTSNDYHDRQRTAATTRPSRLRPGARAGGPRRARHRVEDVLRVRDRVRRRAQHPGLPDLPRPARLAAGGQPRRRSSRRSGSAWR